MENKIFKYLEGVKIGYLTIKTPCGNVVDVGNSSDKIHANIEINDWSVLDLVMSRGDIGFGEAYIKGLFTTDKIENLLLFISLNQEELEPLFHSNILYSILFGIRNLFKRNSLKGSKKNIEYHYDLGNDFYSLWLDKTMSYSSGIFFHGDSSLKESQKNKYNRILDQIDCNNSNILEIGCGWGGFISEASKRGHYVKGLTLSNEQKLYSDEIIKNEALSAEVVMQDYRLEAAKFDNIVSIEMFEAVGRKYWNSYFAKIKECLRENGKAVIQTIVINDEFYKKYLRTSDYIREYIFPGGFLPSPSIFQNLVTKHKLKIVDQFKFGKSYEKTLIKWLDNINDSKSDILQLGYDEEFIRKWRFYLAYCAAGFGSRRTDVIQYSLAHD